MVWRETDKKGKHIYPVK